MTLKIILIGGILFTSAFAAFAQKPVRLNRFASNLLKKNQRGFRRNAKSIEEMEYVFSAKYGQKVRAAIASTAPKGKFHAFKIVGADGVGYTTEFDTNYELEFVAPQIGDYLIYVYFRPTEKVRSGKFSLTLSIK